MKKREEKRRKIRLSVKMEDGYQVEAIDGRPKWSASRAMNNERARLIESSCLFDLLNVFIKATLPS